MIERTVHIDDIAYIVHFEYYDADPWVGTPEEWHILRVTDINNQPVFFRDEVIIELLKQTRKEKRDGNC